MARIVISSAGTHGDFVPFVALGKRLRTHGHDVVMAVNPAMLHLAEAAQLAAVPCGQAFGPEDARSESLVFDFWHEPDDAEIRRQWQLLDLDTNFRDLSAACRGADLLVASSIHLAALWVHEKSGVPCVVVVLMPMRFPHVGDAAPAPPTENERRLEDDWLAFLNRCRRSVGLADLAASATPQRPLPPCLTLLAASRHFSQPILDDFSQVRQTGFWFDDPPSAWTPEPDLAAFCTDGPGPLVLTFGSAPVRDAAHLLAVHRAAAARLGRKLLIQRGWADLGGDTDPTSASATVRVTGVVPHSWLFQHAAAVIHHGGVGTMAQALRCGCPMLVEPLGSDQFFNARRVLALGVGAVMHPHKLTADGLARVLGEKVLIEPVRQRATALSKLLQAEDGLSMACDLIESELASRP